MKKYVFLLILFAGLLGKTATGQDGIPESLTWFGLDYTQVKFIGSSSDFSDLNNIQNSIFAAWNGLFLSEQSKYDLRAAFGVPEVSYEMDRAIERSSNRNMDNIVQTGPWELGKEELAQVMKAYIDKSGGEDRVGAMFIMETLNKLDKRSTMWLVVFNVGTGKIHHLKRYSGAPGGFGFRNYWARSYYNVLNQLAANPRKPF